MRLGCFAALGLFGTISWSSLLSGGGDELRLFGMLGLSVVIAAVSLALGPRRRWLLVPVGLLGLLVAFAIAGVPVAWIVHPPGRRHRPGDR